MMLRTMTNVALLVSLFPMAVVSAQARQIGGVGLTVFEDPGFRGRSATLRDDTRDFKPIGLNDVISSLRVGPNEQWEVCENANYRGRCVVVSGSERDLTRSGWSNTISSARRVHGGDVDVPPTSARHGLEMYSGTGFTGDWRPLDSAEPDLRRVGFNDRAMSLRVRPGETWQICAEPNFRECVVVNASLSDLGGLRMTRRVSSARRWNQGGPTTGNVRLVLYRDPGFRGQGYEVNGARPSLPGPFIQSSSVQVSGGTWELCDAPRFQGRCVTVSSNVRNLNSVGMNDRVRSLRPIPDPR
jgi:beta/gamma crystallin